MPEVATLHNWSTAQPYIASAPTWVVDDMSKMRVGAYTFYDSQFLNAPDTWKVLMYATNRRPVYVPSAKVLINTINRYVAPGMEVIADPTQITQGDGGQPVGAGSDATAVDPAQPLRDLFRTTGFYATFAAEKRMGSVRGDWLFMLQGDLEKVEGHRLSIVAVDPAAYFPIWSEEDPDVRIGVHIVEQWEINGDPYIYRTTFRKETPEGIIGGPGTITVEEAVFKTDEWGGPGGMKEGSPVQTVRSAEPLDPRITEIPVYHFRNNYRNGEDFGTSDLAGLESLMVSINQNASDEDIALALVGLGVYTTDAGAPVDEDTGEELPWEIGPARVVERPTGSEFDRVPGILTVQPYLDHIGMLNDYVRQTAALSDVAMGRVDVNVAESGIALALELAPTIAMAEEKELEIKGRLIEMFNDIKSWLLVYEGINLGETRFIPKFNEKIPVNRAQRFTELITLLDKNVVSTAYVRAELRRLGYDMPDDASMLEQIIAEKQAMQQIVSDVTGSRLDSELNSGDPATA